MQFTHRHPARRPVWVVICLLSTLWACGVVEGVLENSSESSAHVADAVASIELAQIESAFMAVALAGDLSGSAETLSSAAADAAEATFSPADCVVAVDTVGTVTYTLENCDGPFALSNLSGTAVTVYSSADDGALNANVTATDLEANGGLMTLNASGTVESAGAETTVALTTGGAGTTEDGRIMARVGTYTVRFDDTCLAISGTWATTSGETTYTTIVSDYERCGTGCPTDGGSLVFTEIDTGGGELLDSALTISFDGTDTATYISATSLPGMVSLDCTP